MRHVLGPFGEEEDAEYEEVDGQARMGSGTIYSTTKPPVQASGGGTTILGGGAPAQQAAQPAAPAYSYGQGNAVPSEVADQLLSLAMDQRARALSLFVELPFMAYIALHPRMPGFVRVGAAALGFVRAVEVVQRQKELEQYLPELSP
jgi:hypothetical protein